VALVAAQEKAAPTQPGRLEELVIMAVVVVAVQDKGLALRELAAQALVEAMVELLPSVELLALVSNPQAAVAGLAAGHPVLAARAA
jgi:hypothetical protein